MDDTPRGLLGEFRSSVLKKRVGQIALGIVLAESMIRLVSALTWYLIIPIIGKFLHGQTESVILESARSNPIRWDTLFGSVLEFALAVIVVLYLNRWIQRKPSRADEESEMADESVEEQPLTADRNS